MLFMLFASVMAQSDPRTVGESAENFVLTAPAGIVGALLIAPGLVFLFFGYRLFKVVCFIAGFYFGCILAYIILSAAEPSSLYNNRDLVYLLGSLAVGLAVGFLFLCIWRLGLSAIGALFGYSLAIFILSWAKNGAIESSTGRSIFIGVLTLVGAIVIIFFEKPLLIVSTSFSGAFSIGKSCVLTLLVYGVDVFAHKGFIQAVQYFTGNHYQISGYQPSNTVYGMLASILVIAVLGVVIQYRIFGNHTHREK